MDLSILTVGRLKAGPETELCKRYLDRAAKAGRAHGLQGFSVRELPEARAQRTADRKAQEADALSAALRSGYQSICLDEGGDLIDSDGLAKLILSGAEQGLPGQAFIIGGPDGLDPALIGRCDRRLSFGRLTWPHQLVRVMLAEQLYRAMTILSGHPYHRA
jgi:23S rRNA (pseudouridine1915-N3)-methyltransferase